MEIPGDEFKELEFSGEPAWLQLERATSCRKRLLKAGFWPLPAAGKEPPIAGWTDIAATDKIIDTWEAKYPDAVNTGILTRTTPAIDIDILVPAAADAIEALAREHFGERGFILVRFGMVPKRAILLRTDDIFKKIKRKFTAPDNSPHQIEIIANGQQVVVFGIHPDTERPYSWHGGEPGDVLRNDLPSVCEADMITFLDAATELLIKDHGFKLEKPDKPKSNGGQVLAFSSAAGVRERAYAEATLENCTAELAAAPTGSRNDTLNKIAFRLGRMTARNWTTRIDVEAALIGAMQSNGYIDEEGLAAAQKTARSGLDAGEKDPHPGLDKNNEEWTEAKGELRIFPRPSRGLIIKSSAQFIADFVPPDYIVKGLLQQGFLYAITGMTGAGKTAITMRLAASIALGIPFANRKTKKGRVLYLAAENPTDIHMRWIALAQQMDFDGNEIEVYFIEGVFSISAMANELQSKVQEIGGEFNLVVVDTGPVFYEGDDENSRTQMGHHADMLRQLITIIPGRPVVIANGHPTKNAPADNLLPAGGGSFLNSIDGNLTVSKTDSTSELHWQGKFRGVEFAPMHFMIRTVTHERLKDSDGDLIPTVVCDWISDNAKDDIAAARINDQDRMLGFIAADPKASWKDLAIKMDWKLYSGEPHKTKVRRCIQELIKGKLIKETRSGHYHLTDEGEKVLGSTPK